MRNPKYIKTERKLATIRKVKEIYPIKGADRIEVAVVDGWECVVKKSDNFKKGDNVIYIEIDSIVPERPEFEFLRDRKFRIKTIKLRKQISQGLVLDLSSLKKKNYKLGADVTTEMGILKYDPELAKEREVKLKKPKTRLGKWLMKFAWYRSWRKRIYRSSVKSFPGWIFKTDESRVQNIVRLYDEAVASGKTFTTSEKVDGQSFTTYVTEKEKTFVCSRNLGVSKTGNSSYASIFKSCDLDTVLKALKKELNCNRLALQGEICGPGIQGNKYKLETYKLLVFNLIPDGKKLDYDTMTSMLKPYNIETVYQLDSDFTLPGTIKELVEYSKGISHFYNRKREGVVIRSKDYTMSFKVINPEFLLEDKD